MGEVSIHPQTIHWSEAGMDEILRKKLNINRETWATLPRANRRRSVLH